MIKAEGISQDQAKVNSSALFFLIAAEVDSADHLLEKLLPRKTYSANLTIDRAVQTRLPDSPPSQSEALTKDAPTAPTAAALPPALPTSYAPPLPPPLPGAMTLPLPPPPLPPTPLPGAMAGKGSCVLETMRLRAELLDRACQSVYIHDKHTAATQQTHWLHTHVWLLWW